MLLFLLLPLLYLKLAAVYRSRSGTTSRGTKRHIVILIVFLDEVFGQQVVVAAEDHASPTTVRASSIAVQV